MPSYKSIDSSFEINEKFELNNQPDVVCDSVQILEFSSDLSGGSFTVKQEVTLIQSRTYKGYKVRTTVLNNKSVLTTIKAQVLAVEMTKDLAERKKEAIATRMDVDCLSSSFFRK